jgi:hypothetical protein
MGGCSSTAFFQLNLALSFRPTIGVYLSIQDQLFKDIIANHPPDCADSPRRRPPRNVGLSRFTQNLTLCLAVSRPPAAVTYRFLLFSRYRSSEMRQWIPIGALPYYNLLHCKEHCDLLEVSVCVIIFPFLNH